jgi:EAL and modified HD-GYP domain-containing signal transduction protein
MPMEEIVKTMPLAQPIESALVTHDGLLGQLLDITTSYILGHKELSTNKRLEDNLAEFSLDKLVIQQEFLDASEWCTKLDLDNLTEEK